MDMLEEAAEQLIEGEALPFLLPVIQPPEPQDRPGASAAAGLQAEVAPDLTLVPSLGAPAAAQAEVARGNRCPVDLARSLEIANTLFRTCCSVQTAETRSLLHLHLIVS